MTDISFVEPEESESTMMIPKVPLTPTQRRVSRGGTYIYSFKEFDAENEKSDHSVFDHRMKLKINESERKGRRISLGGLRFGNTFKPWGEISNINFVPSTFFDVLSQAYRRRSRSIAQGTGADMAMAFASSRRNTGISHVSTILSSQALTTGILAPPPTDPSDEVDFGHFEKLNLAKHLLNENNLWGCFYVYPDLYNENEDTRAVPIRQVGEEPGDVPELGDGVLTRDMVTTCLTYLKKTPLLKAFVYIKLDISHKYLTNIDVLKHYKYLVYLDMSSNLLTNLDVLTYLPYLQYLSVSYNRLGTVLEYENPQWFLTDVVYKFNSVKTINDLTKFWSLAVLDLSHNNIKEISGLENLHYLRRLDLSFNHISTLENLNHLPITWLDVSYNKITSFEFSENTGLWTLLDLEYLNLNENGLTSMKLFCRCNRLRELYARNNRFNRLLELAVYMKQLRGLRVLDLRENGVCSISGYKENIIKTFPVLLRLDESEMDCIEQRMARRELEPDILSFATHRLLRLLYVEQLKRSKVSYTVPPADTTEVPLVVLVGCEASGKGKLLRRLTKECSSMVAPALMHTTAVFHFPESYIQVTRRKFDDMILDGEFLTYSEIYGESYGLSREEAWITNKVKIVAMDLTGALMLRLRGRRPYMILIYNHDKETLRCRQKDRKSMRTIMTEEAQRKSYVGVPIDKNTLQVMVSGRLLVNGIINELMMKLPDLTPQDSAFVVESECSLFQDSQTRQTAEAFTQAIKLSNILDNLRSNSTASSLTQELSPLYQGDRRESDEISSSVPVDQIRRASGEKTDRRNSQVAGILSDENKVLSKRNTIDSNIPSASALRDHPSKTSNTKSVTFTGELTEPISTYHTSDGSEMIDEPVTSTQFTATECTCWDASDDQMNSKIKSPKGNIASARALKNSAASLYTDPDDIWQAFLADFDESDINVAGKTVKTLQQEAHESLPMKSLFEDLHKKVPKNADYYEEIHRQHPGYFWDTVAMDDPEAAFRKMKRILQDIVNSQKYQKPMYDIDFVNMTQDYPHIENRLNNIYQEIAPHRLFN